MALLRRAVLTAPISPHAGDAGHVYAQIGQLRCRQGVFGPLRSVRGGVRVSPTPSGERSRPAGSPAPDGAPYDPADHLRETDSPAGRLRHALPPVSFTGAPATWATPPGRCGADAPVWR